MANSKEIKQQFLNFFKSKGHRIVPSAPIVVKGDPTLMFTNAGMNQFKDYFLGNAIATDTRVADTQKCLRVSGKHNDLEEVGHDHYHHTMFEMLGNWSFGDYFKADAIAWAWELLTEVYKLPKDQLYVTVFEGDASENLAFDQESYDIWKQYIAEDRILKGNKKDNFWEMGDTGPCGPCTEIHFDGRSAEDRAAQTGAHLVNADHADVIEIWNNVFMEFNRKADGSLEPLPAKHVDTGMGFERLVRVIEGKSSNYDTDVFQYIIQATAAQCNKSYGADEKQDIAFRVIADHIRAVALCIADGQLPSNTGAGYVVRRILRRAVRYGFSYLGLGEPFMCNLVPHVGAYFNDVFPELEKQQDFVARVIREEEASFFRTLSHGIQNLNAFEESGNKVLSGEMAFELYDTFGFPIDLTQLICREKGIDVDIEGFEKELQAQKQRSRADSAKETGDWQVQKEDSDEQFVGYDELVAETFITRFRTVKTKGKEQFHVVLENSPFYAESGGQVGDSGLLKGADNQEIIHVIDTQKENKLHILVCNTLPKNPSQAFVAEVKADKRRNISNNHSATHLMHSALREVLGTHVAQKGSLVNEQYLRFDFSHFSKMTDEELQQIENRVNEKIRESIPLTEYRDMPVNDALALGATALFGEKYGDSVRVIVFDPAYSMELCGGTHVQNTSQIGMFKILGESSVAAGVRRVEAITGAEAFRMLQELQEKQNRISNLLGNPRDIEQAVAKLLEEQAKMQQQLDAFGAAKVKSEKQRLLAAAVKKSQGTQIIERIDISNADDAKNLAFQLKSEIDDLFCVLAWNIDDKPGLAVMVGDSLMQASSWDASAIVRDLAKEIQGGGGGQKFFATAGGKDASGIQKALDKAQALLS
ncbi:MAG: alanine--tRNA ligase [Bacteroidota bacterium]|jgi:alanyl-tRNA synthetase